ncbi:MAG: tetratricopeptide repeat protein [Gammaproteobacteria bacterium]|nr:tetratricopeptide repeat protein [Gammaproteobacteria bacterium]
MLLIILSGNISAQIRGKSVALPSDPVIVLGTSFGEVCYQHAIARDGSRGALEDCNTALDDVTLIEPDKAATLINRGIIRNLRGDTAGALEDFNAAARFEPAASEAMANIGAMHISSRQWRDALNALDRALGGTLTLPQRAHFNRAVAREELGDLRGAFEDYAEASRLDPAWEAPQLELQRFRRTPVTGR